MQIALLIIIYLAFISLGLPDGLLGSAWPVMQQQLHAPLSMAGYITMTISMGTITSSLLSEKMIRRFGTGNITVVSVFLTAAGLWGFYASSGLFWLFVAAIPMGIGAGAVDAALNNFVALHYKAIHMNFLHCFWGLGAMLSPYIMSVFISKNQNWRDGYQTVSIVQFSLVVLLLVSLPLWKKYREAKASELPKSKSTNLFQLLHIKGAKTTLTAFFCYCGAELMAGLWGSTYLVQYKGLSVSKAARWISYFYVGITIGRVIAGFVSLKISNKSLVRIGILVILLGIVLLLLPIDVLVLQALGIALVGLGCAPVYPALLHDTPNRFGSELSQSIMGIQMACAYMGSLLVPPLFGILAQYAGIAWYPWVIGGIILVMFAATESVNRLEIRRE